MSEHFSWTSTIPLRWRDLDAQQHVFHGVHVTLFDQARGNMLAAALTQPDPLYVIARLDLEYLHELTLDDSPVEVTSTVVNAGTTSITTQERISSRHGHEIAYATAVLVWWEKDTGAKRALTDTERTALLAHAADQPA
ncbi:acyl-CoA thioesterase [Rhodococcus pseudokoreensis]|uniref:Acyl-CoA thioesterase n=1 Tax=Rhodococcus pseudokoreensis TaxID=2811421 RepID=A0A974ZWK8_9NOCA|nr:acyl-CoA thioesterase [Rhodococcus pseudokoreensis]QSE92622.1 acyl-CoA thioesterase [Rhodococcus pseudokoreensis]